MSRIGLEPLSDDERDPIFAEHVRKVNEKRDRYLQREKEREEKKEREKIRKLTQKKQAPKKKSTESQANQTPKSRAAAPVAAC